jgi:hypothetical protein
MKDKIIIPEVLKPYLDHCYKCGSLKVVKKKWQESFDGKTGKREFLYKVECPNYSWWPDLFHGLDWHETHEYMVGIPEKLFGMRGKHTTVLERV